MIEFNLLRHIISEKDDHYIFNFDQEKKPRNL